MANDKMDDYAVAMFENEVVECGDPVEIARKVKLAFKKMSGEMALACFAKVITAELPHPTKVAVWDAVRYSHIWWGVDEVLKGDVMNNRTTGFRRCGSYAAVSCRESSAGMGDHADDGGFLDWHTVQLVAVFKSTTADSLHNCTCRYRRRESGTGYGGKQRVGRTGAYVC